MSRHTHTALLLAGAAIMLTGCSKKLANFTAKNFDANPDPLEVVGNRIPATVTAHIPAKFFVKNAEVTVTPYLVYDGTETASQPYGLQGEKVRGNNTVVSYDNGANVTIPVMFEYTPEMMRSELQLAFDVRQGGKQYVLPRVTVANGVLATAALADPKTVAPAVAADKYQRVINEKYAADILFLINRANIRDTELRSEAVKQLNNEIKAASKDDRREIEEINISSYASPEGSLDFNTRLAEDRERNTTNYLTQQLKSGNVTNYGDLTANFTAEDWDGFQRLVAASDIQDKELILSILSMYQDPQEREREIRNLSSIFDQLATEILPRLRYSRITASINAIGRSDEEIEQQFAADPTALSVDEILYCATLTNDNERKIKIYDTAVQLHPDDYRTFNDLGLAYYVAGDYAAAKENFDRALRVNPRSAEARMNLGLLSMLSGDMHAANQEFGAAAGVDGLGGATGTYYLMVGDNAAAVRAFGDTKSNNAALAQILTNDYSRAKNTLAGITRPDATTYYLTAILGARTNNDTMVSNNLRKAVKLNPSLADKAQKDIEFQAYNLAYILN